ncbi:MAG: LacI family DNA-binding transcriptional regulator [Bacteroidetes bacterium]|uniref:LacI family DNA-binding transcriptional regulator n=1 Tax=Candidatus Cryptobacteroides gallistercoris TaxID=2840765 RepID=A0A940DNC2_9BACT|nr:LacI family DNA-binding transcriptional regulator [Candidatus Cryptobacteroides gallistercoris]
MDKGRKITINDVARLSGVSKGTVDRVLHNRGEVSKESRDRVLRVIDELGYRPNIYASLLASRRQHKIICVIPEYLPGEFWELTERGLVKGGEYAADYGIEVKTVKYDQYDLESFQQACARTLEERPSGVIIAPLFRTETFRFVSELKSRGIVYMYIDSKLEDDSYLAYFGMPMYQSGYLCADLLTDGRKVRKVHVIRIARDKKGLSDPTVTRRAGFMDYMSEHCPETEIENVFIDPKDASAVRAGLDRLFSEDTDPHKYLVMFNSRVHLVADYLREHGIATCRVVGFDVLERNLAALKDGFVQLLIGQHADSRTEDAVVAMTEWLLLHKPIARKDNFTQMDILNRYNCDYYLQQ